MRHLNAGRKLGIDSSHRVAMMRSMTLALIERETIQTTPAKAKELRWYAERVVTLAKKGDLSSRRRIVRILGSTKTQPGVPNRIRVALERLYTKLAPRFQNRAGGYTQILRLADRRLGDNAELCIMRYLPPPDEKKTKGDKKAKKPTKKVAVKADKASGKTAEKSEKATKTPKKKKTKVEDKE